MTRPTRDRGEIDPHCGKAQTATKRRFQFLLAHDRVQLSPAQMEMMRNEFLNALMTEVSRFFVRYEFGG